LDAQKSSTLYKKRTKKMEKILNLHKQWTKNRETGVQADLSNVKLSKFNLSGVNLSEANLSNADLSDADLSHANLNRANLSQANLRRTNLSNTDLSNANLSSANLSHANLHNADMRHANLKGSTIYSANMAHAKLRYADLSDARLSETDLSGADLRRTNLRYADFSKANMDCANISDANTDRTDFSGTKNLRNQNASDYIMEHFEKSAEGIICYKEFGMFHASSPKWIIEAGSIIEENVNSNRTNECGCGINVGTLSWIKRNCTENHVWKCLIKWEWLPDVVVPYHTDGKIRTARIQLLEISETL